MQTISLSSHISRDGKSRYVGIGSLSRPRRRSPAVAILDVKGKSLIQRSYRDDVPPSCVERFLPLTLDMEEENQQVTPCFSDDGINYMHIRHNNLYCELQTDWPHGESNFGCEAS